MLSRIEVYRSMLIYASIGTMVMISQAHAGYQDVVMADNPQYYWTFDDGDANALNKGNGTGGTLQALENASLAASTATSGGLSLGQGIVLTGGAFQSWVADDDHGVKVQVGTAYESYALEYWMKLDTASGATYIMNAAGYGYGYYDTPSIIFDFTVDTQELYTAVGRTGAAFGTISSDTWYHVVIGVKGSGTDIPSVQTCIYNGDVDNALTANSAMMAFSAERTMTVGSHGNLNVHTPTGMIDEFAIYDLTGLSQTEYEAKLASIAGHCSAVPEPGMLVILISGLIGLLLYVRS